MLVAGPVVTVSALMPIENAKRLVVLLHRLFIMSLRGTKQSQVEKQPCRVRDCFVPRNDMVEMVACVRDFYGIIKKKRKNFL